MIQNGVKALSKMAQIPGFCQKAQKPDHKSLLGQHKYEKK